ncbi:U-box domain-containing protein 3 isoform X2 [Eucalyptus grandis]|uniref:U-box domain-containing protein 3 isoform X2 n=1 Tax=Eucalyptus grandis TaxID=71139 RepID=UPI0005259E11|nr:U-box domain-containing protein 3 isoform X2 [Eucalyptus grandis]
MDAGQMDTSVSCLINSISRFIHLVMCQTRKSQHLQQIYGKTTEVLKLLKPLLDDVVEHTTPILDEILYKEFEELDMAVNMSREFLENWSPRMSKICSVLQSKTSLMKIQTSSLEICQILCRLSQSGQAGSSFSRIQELQRLKQEGVAEFIEEVLINQRDGILPCADTVSKIIELLNLRSKQELFKESLAVEKERMRADVNEVRGEFDEINQVIRLMSYIRDFMIETDFLEADDGMLIPPYFRCPLSLELMMDPVIVASGQTYERASIQKWLDHGLTVCPKTRQLLTHTNLIPNYTVKAMVEGWCKHNNIRLFNSLESHGTVPVLDLSDHGSPQNLVRTDSFSRFLQSSSSTSRSSSDIGNRFEKQKSDISCRSSGEESNGGLCREIERVDIQSAEKVHTHSRSESTSSAISSVDYIPQTSIEVSTRLELKNLSLSSEKISSRHGVNKDSVLSPHVLRNQSSGSNTRMVVGGTGNCNQTGTESSGLNTRMVVGGTGNCNQTGTESSQCPNSAYDHLTTYSHVKILIENLKNQSNEVHTKAAAELRFLAKHNMENRLIIGQSGAITPLLSLLYSRVRYTQEHAVTAILNLSINEENKAMIAEAGAIEPLIHVLKSGNEGARENAAATLFSISLLEEYKAKIGRSGAVKALVDLLGSGTPRGKKDAATALFNLSIFHENKARIVQAGAVKYLIELMDPDTGMVDKAVALLANLSTTGEGRLAIVREGGIPLLVEVIESGSHRGKENAASVLLQLCLNSPKFCTLVLQEGAVPPLVALSQSGTARAKEKAQQLLGHFRNQREGAMVKGKS